MLNVSKFIVLLSLFSIWFNKSVAQDFAIIADKYRVEKGDTVTYTLYQGRGLDKSAIAAEGVDAISNGFYYQGGKKITGMLKVDSSFAKLAAVQENAGQSLIGVEFSGGKVVHDQLTVEDFAKTENLTDMNTVIDSSGFTTEYTANTFFIAKALTITDKHNGSLQSNKEGQLLEVSLAQNPYKLQYGDDVTATVLLNGKVLEGASATVYTRSATDQVYSTKLRSNGSGKFFFKLNRSGLWLIQVVYANPSEEEGIDYNYYQSSYSFSFQ